VKLSEPQTAFLVKRQRRLRYLPYAGAFIGATWWGLVVWLWLAHPLLVNPFEVQQRLQSDMLADSTLVLMALVLPLAIDMCLLLTLVVIVFTVIAFTIERRYAEIVRTAGYQAGDGAG
jgi:hypothetical protein